ncbi:nitronate monooxygenase [Neptunicella marina]
MKTLCQLLNITYPIIQAPMVGVSTPTLAAAVSNAGALGSIGIGASSLTQAREMILATRQLTSRPFNVNLFCHRPAVANREQEANWLAYLAPHFARLNLPVPSTINAAYASFVESPAMLELLLELKPSVVSFHFGLASVANIQQLQQAGIVVLACVTNINELSAAEQAGVDAVVAQGAEAGGHRGMFDPSEPDTMQPLNELLTQLLPASSIPVIAAGGIMQGQQITRLMQMGVAGAQLGTAFILCPESAANSAYRQKLQSPAAANTQFTSCISGRPARGMVNRLYLDDDLNRPDIADYPIAYSAAKKLAATAIQHNDDSYSAQWAGQGAPLAQAMPAAELVKQLVAQMARAD